MSEREVRQAAALEAAGAIPGQTPGLRPGLTPREAREYVESLSGEELAVLAEAVERQLKDSGSGDEGGSTGWDYQRQTWGSGWIQRDPKVRRNRDGSVRVYGYWYFHWIENGKRRSKYIGGDDALAEWMERNPR